MSELVDDVDQEGDGIRLQVIPCAEGLHSQRGGSSGTQGVLACAALRRRPPASLRASVARAAARRPTRGPSAAPWCTARVPRSLAPCPAAGGTAADGHVMTHERLALRAVPHTASSIHRQRTPVTIRHQGLLGRQSKTGREQQHQRLRTGGADHGWHWRRSLSGQVHRQRLADRELKKSGGLP
jgi:hypothetical protein